MHKHAKIIMEWAQMMQLPESEWRVMQFKSESKDWGPCSKVPYFYDYHEYRWMPRTIRIGDYYVPEPVTVWKYENGTLAIVFDDMESCELAHKALLSLTQKKD